MTATTRPGTSTAAGYYILQFNDTLQSTTPILIKIELGTGGAATTPALWVTVGTGSNGSGTLTGLSTRIYCGANTGPASSVTNYQSRACYNATQGVLWIDWKQSSSVSNETTFCFHIFRSVDNTGAPTATAVGFQGMSTNNTASASNAPADPVVPGLKHHLVGAGEGTPTGWSASNWCIAPYKRAGGAGSTVEGTAGQVFPCFQFAPTATVPGIGVTNAQALCNASEVPYGSTVALTILGSLSLTYISGMVESTALALQSYTATIFGVLRIWQ